MIETLDRLEIYCPHLGTLVTFNYCRRVQSALPCRNLPGCWEGRIAIADFLAENYTQEELESAFGGLPKTRMERIFETIRQTREDPER